ncbi:hypothetical protein L810_6989 [Burkholderia sp. AU4i]|nr:hypothetical protein L810_6989 [Burkholderia sp. AU4i]
MRLADRLFLIDNSPSRLRQVASIEAGKIKRLGRDLPALAEAALQSQDGSTDR